MEVVRCLARRGPERIFLFPGQRAASQQRTFKADNLLWPFQSRVRFRSRRSSIKELPAVPLHAAVAREAAAGPRRRLEEGGASRTPSACGVRAD